MHVTDVDDSLQGLRDLGHGGHGHRGVGGQQREIGTLVDAEPKDHDDQCPAAFQGYERAGRRRDKSVTGRTTAI